MCVSGLPLALWWSQASCSVFPPPFGQGPSSFMFISRSDRMVDAE